MDKITYQILRKYVPKIKLVGLTDQFWYNESDELIPWTSGSLYIGPNTGDVVKNTNEIITEGYYKWIGSIWDNISQVDAYDSFNLPVYLDSSLDEMGGMIGFDGSIEQIEQFVNFTYTQTGQTIQIYSTTNTNKLRKIIEQNYTIDWGDSFTDTLQVNDGILGNSFPTISHTYILPSPNPEYDITLPITFTITITLDTPWTTQKLSKVVEISPHLIFTGTTENPLGTFTGVTVPAYSNLTGQTQDYLNDLDYTNNTGFTTTGFTFVALGKSRLTEKKLYGSNSYSGVTISIIDGISLTGYTIDDLNYLDYPDGYTMITGTTSGYTKEEVFNQVLTRNEHFLGFIEDPIIYSDIFVERGKQNVMEKNLRLGEIDNVGELNVYGNGYFTIKKQ